MGSAESKQNRLEERQQYYREVIRGYTMMSDTFMRNVLKDRSCAEYVLQVILDREDLKILSVAVQQDYKNLQGRSAVLDCVAQDSDGMLYDIEVQQEEEGSSALRARYYSSLMDMNTLDPGKDFDRLPETCVIFITGHDVLREGLPIYHIKRVIQESGNRFPDLSLIIYVNASIQDDSSLGNLIHDFHCRNAADIHSPVLAERVRALKETPQGVESMCREMKEIEEYGRKQGKLQEKITTAQTMNSLGYTIDAIARIEGVSESQVREWISGDAASA